LITLRSVLFSLLLLPLVFCGGGEPPAAEEARPAEVYDVRGEVVRLIPEDQVAVVKHEDIEGWMKAMTMEFPVKDKAEFERLAEGVTFDAKVHVQDLDYWLADIKVVE
jgi:protein SCO1/2